MITLAHKEDRHELKTVLQMANGLLEISMPIVSKTTGLVAELAIAQVGELSWHYHMLRNPAQAKFRIKNGFVQEGVLRQRVRKWGVFEDVALWAILRQDWLLIGKST